MNTANKIILVPVDFSEQSLKALQHAAAVAQVLKGELYVVHILDEPGVISSLFSDVNTDELTEKVWTKLNSLISESNIYVPVHPLVAKGSIYEEVVRISELVGASFIIMGTNGADGIVKRFIGSNALRVVRESRVPVISLKGKSVQGTYKSILLPLDLTKETREKVNKAIELARQFDATIHVVSILLTKDEEVVNKLKQQLHQVEHFLTKAGVKHSADFVHAEGKSSLSAEVLNYVHRVNADLLMIMTQQETDFSDRFVGSAAQEIINTSEIPVCSIIPNVKKDTTVFTPY